jgi:hypothetical protein
VLDQPEADEGIGGGDGYEGVEVTSDGAQAEVSVRGASTTGMARDNTEVEANVSMKAPMTDVATAPEVLVLVSAFVCR